MFYYLFIVLKVQRIFTSNRRQESTEDSQVAQDAMRFSREVAQNGIVLLENHDDLLPLPKGSRLKLIGLRAVQMDYNGGGSAASNEAKCIPLEQALKEAGFSLNQEMLNLSFNYLKNKNVSIGDHGKITRLRKGSKQKGGAEFVSNPGNPVKEDFPFSVLETRWVINGTRLLALSQRVVAYVDQRKRKRKLRKHSFLKMCVDHVLTYIFGCRKMLIFRYLLILG